MVASASPCSMPSRTQCCKWPSSTIWPTRCRAPLTALIWMRISSQGTSLSIIWSMACNWPMSFFIRRCRFSASMHCLIRPPFRAGDIIAGRLSRGGRIRGGAGQVPAPVRLPHSCRPRTEAIVSMRTGRGAQQGGLFRWRVLHRAGKCPAPSAGMSRKGRIRRACSQRGEFQLQGDRYDGCGEKEGAGTGSLPAGRGGKGHLLSRRALV